MRRSSQKPPSPPIATPRSESPEGLRLVVRQEAGGVRFAVKVAPRASRDALTGVSAGALKLSLRAAPVDGAANQALCALLAKTLAVPRRAVWVVAGERSRRKTVYVAGVAAEAVVALCEAP
jgi:uncharacterized protein (TIGR00251 family)